MKQKNKKEFISMLLGTLGASLLGNVLSSKGINRVGYRNHGKGIIRTGYGPKRSSKKSNF